MSFLARRTTPRRSSDLTQSEVAAPASSGAGSRLRSTTSDPSSGEASAPPRRKILTATILALLAAALILVTAVLPAEYGIDLLGTGRLFGLTALSEGTTGAISPQP